MEQINNIKTIEECSKILGYQVEHKPELDTSKINLIADINPYSLAYANIQKRNSSNVTGTITAYTTPTDKDFYLTSLQASYVKDVACDAATGLLVINFTQESGENGTTTGIGFSVITLTAQYDSLDHTFFRPLKLKRGTQITMTGTFTAGVLQRCLSIEGFTL